MDNLVALLFPSHFWLLILHSISSGLLNDILNRCFSPFYEEFDIPRNERGSFPPEIVLKWKVGRPQIYFRYFFS